MRFITLLYTLEPNPYGHHPSVRVTSSSIGHRSPPSDGCASLTVRSLCDVFLSSVSPCSLLRDSSSSFCVDRAAILIRCIKGRSVAKEAQMHPSETSMKLQILSGIMVSGCSTVLAELSRAGQTMECAALGHHIGLTCQVLRAGEIADVFEADKGRDASTVVGGQLSSRRQVKSWF